MKNGLLLFCTFLWLFTGQAQYTKDNLRIDLNPVSLASYTHDQLMIIPVQSTPAFNAYFAQLGSFTVLKEAMEDEKITVKEVSAGGTVNTLVAVNRSQDTIFGMAGEVVKGGKQDRVIAQNFIMHPGDSINLSAFCVEQGRWSAGATNNAAHINGHEVRLKGASQAPVFQETKAVGAQSLRKTALKEKNQQAVWDKVADITRENKAETGTGTYTALWDNDSMRLTMGNYQKQLGEAFDNETSVIGFIAVTGDRVLGCDLFATHDLFIKSYRGLLEGYVTEAVTSGDPVKIDPEEIESYIDQLLTSEEGQADFVKDNGAVFENNGLKLQVTGF